MLYPNGQVMLMLARERQDQLRREAEVCRRKATETRVRRYRLRLNRLRRTLRPLTNAQ